MLIDPILFKRIKEKKSYLDKLRPVSKTAILKLKEQFMIEMTYHSNAIEGNTLTLRETQLVIQEGLTIAGKSLREHLEAINHKEAIEFLENLIGSVKKESSGKIKKSLITENLIRQIHFLILTKINSKEAGKYRSVQVRIAGTDYIFPQAFEVSSLMKDFVKWSRANQQKINPVELATLFHFKFVSIHPFIDGNGRTARLLTNLILMEKGYPPAVILKADRKKYYKVLGQAHQEDIAPFVNLIARSIERSLDMYLYIFEINKTKKEVREKERISLAEASKGTPYSQEYLSLLARQGKLEAHKGRRNWLTTRGAVERYIKNRKRKR